MLGLSGKQFLALSPLAPAALSPLLTPVFPRQEIGRLRRVAGRTLLEIVDSTASVVPAAATVKTGSTAGMRQNLYVGNLSYETTSDDLRTAFSAHGVVLSAQVMMDRDTGRPRGFAFVEMSGGGPEAIQALNHSQLHGRSITVNEARPKSESSRGPSRRY